MGTKHQGSRVHPIAPCSLLPHPPLCPLASLWSKRSSLLLLQRLCFCCSLCLESSFFRSQSHLFSPSLRIRLKQRFLGEEVPLDYHLASFLPPHESLSYHFAFYNLFSLYLAALGLNCSMWGLQSSLWHVRSLVAACGI